MSANADVASRADKTRGKHGNLLCENVFLVQQFSESNLCIPIDAHQYISMHQDTHLTFEYSTGNTSTLRTGSLQMYAIVAS